MGPLAAPFLAKGNGVCRRGRFPDSQPFRAALVSCCTLAAEIRALLVPRLSSERSFPAQIARLARFEPVDDLHPQRRPITVAGPWPIFTAFPFPRPAQIFNRSLSAAASAVKCVACRPPPVRCKIPLRIGHCASENALWRRFIGVPAHGVDPPSAIDQNCGVVRYVMLAVG
jgi:hypothetical protein